SLSDALRPLFDPVAIQEAASRLLVAQLQTSRVGYAECNEDEGLIIIRNDYVRDGAPSRVGVHRFEDFSPALEILRKGRLFVVNDRLASSQLPDDAGARFAAVGVRAQVTVPLLKEGKLVATLTASQTTPREWTPLDVLLVQETAERTWAAVERAHA